jgi:hypothetical protein
LEPPPEIATAYDHQVVDVQTGNWCSFVGNKIDCENFAIVMNEAEWKRLARRSMPGDA